MSDTTEWVAVDDWGTLNVGDRVRAECEGGSLEGAIVSRGGGGSSGSYAEVKYDGLAHETPIWQKDGWQLFIPAKPAVELPTEPGIYSDANGKIWVLAYHDKLTFKGFRWSLIDVGENTNCIYSDGWVADLMPLTKLEPVPETAKKVLEDVRLTIHSCDQAQCSGMDTRGHLRETADLIAERYGIPND